MLLRSGKAFLPYTLKNAFHCRSLQPELISTMVDAELIVQATVAQEDERFEQGADDSEGLGVSMWPLSPLTESESDDEVDAPDLLSQTTDQNSGA